MEIILIYIHFILHMGLIIALILWTIFKILTIVSASKLRRRDIYKNIRQPLALF